MAFSSGYALVVGTATYQYHPALDVPVAARDAEAVRGVLQDPAHCGYAPEQVEVLKDAAVSRQGLLAALDALAQRATADSTVFLYYTGHGDYGTDGQYYFLTQDVRLERNRVAAGTGVSEAEFVDRLRRLKSKRVLILINACHSGEVSPNLGAGEPAALGSATPPENTAAAVLATGEGRIFITACRPDQLSWIGSGQLSLFAQAVVDGLRGGGYSGNNNGYVSAYGLYEHVYHATKEAAARLNKVQEPELTVLRGVGPFPVALYKGATSLGAFAAELPPAETAVREVEPKLAERLLSRSVMNITGDHNVAVQGDRNVVNTGAGGIVVGDITGSTGIAIGHRLQATVYQRTGAASDELARVFAALAQKVAALPEGATREDAQDAIGKLEGEARKGDRADEGRVRRSMETLLEALPDAWEVAVNTVINPLAGLNTVFQKVAERVKMEKKGR